MVIYHKTKFKKKDTLTNPSWWYSFDVQNLVGGWTNPSEKYARQNGFIFPNFRGENTKKKLSCHHLEKNVDC